MRLLLAGASGFLGTALRQHLTAQGHTVTRLVRSEPAGADQRRWDPASGELAADVLEGVDAVVNLAGAPIAHWPWTSSYREQLLSSRLETTRTLATALARRDAPKPALVSASAVGYYGTERADEELTEDSPRGEGFLAGVVARWEQATEPAASAGVRVVLARTAVVLDSSGGALKPMLLPFRLGLGARFGSGSQWFPTIGLGDYVAAIERAATDETMSGPYNLAAPVPATNAELTALLGSLLHRPAVLRIPALPLRAALGELSGQLLGSLKVRPARLLARGFEFAQPDLDSQLRAALR